jgi:hypothetical protein
MSLPTVESYLDIITSEHQDKPNFTAMIQAMAGAAVEIQTVIASMVPAFDLDLAVGSQLDVIGQWAGVSRDVNIPISNAYFSWDGTNPAVGWDSGTWQPYNAPTSVTVLPDDSYRTLIRAKIAANSWDGTTEGAYAIWTAVFPDLNILIQDHENMSYDLIIVGAVPDAITLALITQGYIPLKPEGIRVNNYYTPVTTGPVFGWDLDTEYVQGWDSGSWTIQTPGT